MVTSFFRKGHWIEDMGEGGVKKQEKVVTSFMDGPFQSSDLFDFDIFLFALLTWVSLWETIKKVGGG